MRDMRVPLQEQTHARFSRRPAWRPLVVAALATSALLVGLSGCSALLPAEATNERVGFGSFEAAEQALARVVPYQTTLPELEALGFRIRHSPNVAHIRYPDSIARLAPNGRVPIEDMDAGIRECIAARSGCEVYEFRFVHQTQRRVGNFMLDFFNFRRETVISGWHFNALVVIKDAKVLFTSYGGEPQTDRTERRTNPLGPLQPSGEASGRWLTR